MPDRNGSATYEERLSELVVRADTLYERVSGDPKEARALAETLVREARSQRNAEALVASLNVLARAHRALLDHNRAIPLIEEAARLARRYHLEARLGEVLITRGVVQVELGRARAARRDFDRASVLVDPARAAELDHQRAAFAHNAGRLSEAASRYAEVVKRSAASPAIRAGAANNLGLIETSLGRHQSAQGWFDEAARIAPDAGPVYVALVAESRAWATVKSGNLTEGVARFDDAAKLWVSVDLPLGELYSEYAEALADLRLLPEARDQAERAAVELAEHGVPLMAAEAQLRLASLALAMGDAQLAETVAEETAAMMRHQRRAEWRARATLVAIQARLALERFQASDHAAAVRAAGTLERLGMRQPAAEAYVAAGRVAAVLDRRAKAVADWMRAADLAPRVPVLARLTGHLACAKAAELRQDDAALMRASRSGLSDLAQHRAALPSTELRALASGHGSELAALGLGAVLRTGSAARALGWMERTRANALSAVSSDPVDLGEDDLRALRAIQAEVARARRSDRSALPTLMARQSEIEARIRRRTWTDATSRVPAASRFSIARLRESLADRALVEYDVYDGRVVAAVVEKRRTRIVELADLATVEAEIDELRSALQALSVCVPAMARYLHEVSTGLVERLRSLLVEPLGLRGDAGTVVVPVGELQRVPWSAMFAGSVAVAPSAGLWMQAGADNARAGPVVLGAGPGLDNAVAEVEAIAQGYADPLILIPPRSRVEVVREALIGASLAHLSCHGEVRSDNPTFSSLRLSDGSMTVHELDQRAGAPYRIVLAACDVGGSVTFPGNEVLGFIGTLLTRGTAGVVASTMLVLDEHVTPLMLALHEGIRSGGTLADALHGARATIDPSDPKAYPAWCTFTAFGAA